MHDRAVWFVAYWDVAGWQVEGVAGLDGLLVVGEAVGEPALEHVAPVGHWQRSPGAPLSRGVWSISGRKRPKLTVYPPSRSAEKDSTGPSVIRWVAVSREMLGIVLSSG